jgi:formylglycine-generating enzyme required for sulfatase activity
MGTVRSGLGMPGDSLGGEGTVAVLDLTGEALNNQYEIKRLLGRGGFGTVYLAFDRGQREEIALKVVAVLPGQGPEYQRSLVNEFKVKKKIHDTRHILGVYPPVLTTHKSAEFILLPMEYAEGGSLRQWLQEYPAAQGKKEEREERDSKALDLFRQACAGVGAIHEAGLVHMDLKPENLLIHECVVKVADFGLSRDLGHLSMVSSELLRDGVGTPGYMSPEQIQAANPREVDKESDIYALGCILCELLIGTVPYTGDNRKVLEIHNSGRAPKLKGLDGQCRAAVFACIETDEANRPASVKDLLAVLDGKETTKQKRDREAEEKRKAREAAEQAARKKAEEEAARAEAARWKAERQRKEAERKAAEAEGKRVAAEQAAAEATRRAEKERREREAKARAKAEEEECRRRMVEIAGVAHLRRNEQGLEEYETRQGGVVLVRIPGGEFQMGGDGPSDGKPIHQVRVGDFLIGKYPVKVGEYRRYCSATGRSIPDAPQWGWDESSPMVNVNWYDAVAYCRWAGGRLPTEAEWEYAAGGGAKYQGWAGTESERDLEYYAWYGPNSGGRTQPVGKKKPNLFGQHDMSGNVWEWCLDYPQGPSSGPVRFLRGGSWSIGADRARSACRLCSNLGDRCTDFGFRLALSP